MRLFYSVLFIYIVIEIFFTTLFIREFGAGIFFLEFVLTSLLGMFIMFGSRAEILEGFRNLTQGKISLMDFVGGNFARVVGAFCLIFPGVFADFVGIALEIYAFFALRYSKKSQSSSDFYDDKSQFSDFRTFNESTSYYKSSSEEIIDVEIVQEEKNLK